MQCKLADNEAQINRKETCTESCKCGDEKTRRVRIAAKKGATSNDLTPMLHTALDNLWKSIIKTGIPFKVEERVADIEKIKADLKSGNITQEKALSLTLGKL
jgi:hypothetical protein